MTGLEIALFVLGTIFIVISFFIVDNRPVQAADETDHSDAAAGLDSAKEKVVEEVTKEADIILHETEDKLESLSNDKIMAVGEYSDQILEKIESNHKEVVFLYQMLKDKEEELKTTAQQLESVRIECSRVIMADANKPKSALETLTEGSSYEKVRQTWEENSGSMVLPASEENSGAETDAAAESGNTGRTSAPAEVRREPVRRVRTAETVHHETGKDIPSPDVRDTDSLSRNEEIIALHKKHKSVLEISKLLGMGQGEVRLIIDLYCK